jgi:rfaE bifunctional protein nucleotidyltransferase chain/domain
MFKVNNAEVYYSKKIVTLEEASKLVSKLKTSGKSVGLCHGCFDLLHPGHMKHLESAKELCDIIFVSLTSDKFVVERKGSERPIFSENLRTYMIACLESVDYTFIAPSETCIEVIRTLKPSYYIKGPDIKEFHSLAIDAEREAIKAVGGEIRYTEDPKLATTNLISYIKKLN